MRRLSALLTLLVALAPALAAQASVAIQHSEMTDRLLADAILHHEVAVAREIQLSTLPRKMPRPRRRRQTLA